MNRRDFLKGLGATGLVTLMPGLAVAAADAPYGRLLVLVELKGGNDGLNTVVPYADADYYQLRPHIAIKREDVVQLSEQTGLHPALQPLMPLWQDKQLAIVQGVGYPQPNLSHFRSIEIWDTASASDEYLEDGWLARLFQRYPPPREFAADGVILGGQNPGPLQGPGIRAVTLNNEEQFMRQARLAQDVGTSNNPALAHVLKVERDITNAAARLDAQGIAARPLQTEFPPGQFGQVVKTACQVVSGGGGVAVLRLTLNGFDTHQNQPGTQANLLKQLGEGLTALRAGLTEVGVWDRTLVMSYAEFGRRPKENQSNGTDHGTANAHFVLGGAVRGGLYGAAPDLRNLNGDGNMSHAVDFRSLYATAIQRWWGLPSNAVLADGIKPVELLRA